MVQRKSNVIDLAIPIEQIEDAPGYRSNVGLILANGDRQVLWAHRLGQRGWQFPQGGIEPAESIFDAAYRELFEEVGVEDHQVDFIASTRRWIHYDLPRRLLRKRSDLGQFKGQRQIWMLFYLQSGDSSIRLSLSKEPEFDQWRWVDFWLPLDEIVAFKKNAYQSALAELEPHLRLYFG